MEWDLVWSRLRCLRERSSKKIAWCCGGKDGVLPQVFARHGVLKLVRQLIDEPRTESNPSSSGDCGNMVHPTMTNLYRVTARRDPFCSGLLLALSEAPRLDHKPREESNDRGTGAVGCDAHSRGASLRGCFED